MSTVDILKRAWATTWRYKILWLFGLFAGSASGGSSNFNYNTGSSGGSSGTGSAGSDAFARQMLGTAEHYLPLLIAMAVLLTLIGIVFFVLTFAAQGGLVHLANEAEEKREVRAGDGWRVGFKFWGRTFLIDLLIYLPMLLVVFIFAIIFGASLVGIIGGAVGLDKGSSAAGAGLAGGIFGMCCAFVLLMVAAIAYSIIFGTTAQLALRYAVLEDRGAVESIKAGWKDVWAKRGAVGMFFTLWLVSILYGIALSLVLAIFVIPMAFMAISGNIAGAVGVGLIMSLVAALPAAIFGAFVSTAWTIFFRRMSGREQQPAVPAYAGGYPPPAAGSAFPPAPPAAGYAPPSASDFAEQAPAPGSDPWIAANGLPDAAPVSLAAPEPAEWVPEPPPAPEAPAEAPPAPPASDEPPEA
jgi:hypothetical protein